MLYVYEYTRSLFFSLISAEQRISSGSSYYVWKVSSILSSQVLATLRAIVSLCVSLFSGVGKLGVLLPSDEKVFRVFNFYNIISLPYCHLWLQSKKCRYNVICIPHYLARNIVTLLLSSISLSLHNCVGQCSWLSFSRFVCGTFGLVILGNFETRPC